MSHFTTINIQIRDIDAVKAACSELGLSVEENTQARGYGSKRQHGDYVIRLNGPYDVALERQADGSY
ncbi:MAG: DUF1257 domain-containing protein, partial [Candidatus Pacebacteria bacterium]|nr:DUF1257 domain-containing protein [Candidatus Paceibacterota bacterium]